MTSNEIRELAKAVKQTAAITTIGQARLEEAAKALNAMADLAEACWLEPEPTDEDPIGLNGPLEKIFIVLTAIEEL